MTTVYESSRYETGHNNISILEVSMEGKVGDAFVQNHHSKKFNIASQYILLFYRQHNKEFIVNIQRALDVIHGLGIKELHSINTLNVMRGDYINLQCRLPNGEMGKVLNDSETYLAAQAEIDGDEKCYGVAADGNQIAVFKYGCGGAGAELIIWLRYSNLLDETQQVDSAEASTIAVPPSDPSGSPR